MKYCGLFFFLFVLLSGCNNSPDGANGSQLADSTKTDSAKAAVSLARDSSGYISALGDLTKGDTNTFCYAVIGDYGDNSAGELKVANMVKGWKPNFIITTGDNDYEDKDDGGGKYAGNIDTFIGKYYASYINSDVHSNRFFPCLGNHDLTQTAQHDVLDAYFDYFPFLNKARNYDFSWGPIHFFSINTGPNNKGYIEPAVLATLKVNVNKGPEPYHLVFFHHPKYSSAHGNNAQQNDLTGYNIDAVLNGHIHYYERMRDTIRHIEYITIGCSGRNNDTCPKDAADIPGIVECSCKDKQNGAVKATVNKTGTGHWRMKFEYYNADSPKAASDSLIIIK